MTNTGIGHLDLRATLTSEEFKEVGAEIGKAFDHFEVPEREEKEVLAAIVAGKHEVVNARLVRVPDRIRSHR